MGEFEGQVTTPENQTNDVDVNETENESNATPAEGDVEGQENETRSKNTTSDEKRELQIVSYLKEKGELPKGVEAFRDKNDGKIKFVVPMDGEQYAVTFKQLVNGFNLEQTGKKRLDEAKSLEKQIRGAISDIKADNPNGKKNLVRLLEKLGYDRNKLSEEWMSDYLADMQKTDEERAREKRIVELEEKERILKEKEEQLEGDRTKTVVSQRQQHFTNETIKALKEAKLDNIQPELKKKLMVKTFSRLYEDRLAKQGEERPVLMTAKEALEDILNEYQLVISDALNMYGTEAVRKRIPKSFIDAVLKDSFQSSETPRTLKSFEPMTGVEAENETSNKAKTQTSKKGKIFMSDYFS